MNHEEGREACCLTSSRLSSLAPPALPLPVLPPPSTSPPPLPAASRPVPCALPLEEALDWSSFATLTDVYDLRHLGKQLQCLLPQVSGWGGGRGRVWTEVGHLL